MEADVRKWGNSLAIRLPKAEADRLGLKEGDHVEVALKKAGRRPRKAVDLSDWPLIPETRSDVSERHDEFLYGKHRELKWQKDAKR